MTIKKDFTSIYTNFRQDVAEFFFSSRWFLPQELANGKKVSEAVSIVKSRWPNTCQLSQDAERPVFIFSAGWRSGSTLVQRLVLSSKEIVVWGEPLGEAAFIQRLAYFLSYITGKWPPETFFARDVEYTELSKRWTANLTPEIRYLHSAHRGFLLNWFKTPAQDRFFLDRWGLKEVRLTIDDARYLKWVFPNARFVFVFRNPFDAFRSWKGNKWRSQWPRYNPRSAIIFARHWKLLLSGYILGYKEVDGILLKFEDLISGQLDLEKIANHIEVSELDELVLQKKINSPKKNVSRPEISVIDRAIIKILCAKTMRMVGYRV